MSKQARQTRFALRKTVVSMDYRVPRVGEIANIDAEGRAWVRLIGSHGDPVCARSTLDAPAASAVKPSDFVGAQVLLMFEEGDPNRPIVIGLLHDALRPEPVRVELTVPMQTLRDVVVDGRRLTFEA